MKNGILEPRSSIGHMKNDEILFLFIIINVIVTSLLKEYGMLITFGMSTLLFVFRSIIFLNKLKEEKEISLNAFEKYNSIQIFKYFESITLVLILISYFFTNIKLQAMFDDTFFLGLFLLFLSNLFCFFIYNQIAKEYDSLNGESKHIVVF